MHAHLDENQVILPAVRMYFGPTCDLLEVYVIAGKLTVDSRQRQHEFYYRHHQLFSDAFFTQASVIDAIPHSQSFKGLRFY